MTPARAGGASTRTDKGAAPEPFNSSRPWPILATMTRSVHIMFIAMLSLALPSPSRAANFSLLGGGTLTSENNAGVGLQGALRLEFDVGKKLWISFTPSTTYFTETFYLVDIPLTLGGNIPLSQDRQIFLGGGIGGAFSDLPAWQEKNRALIARITARWIDQNLFDSRLVPELLLCGSSTSTGNPVFITFRLGYRL